MEVKINADDYGWNYSCTLAIMEAFKKEYITTTTMCANGDAFDFATELIMSTKHKENVGVHFVLTEGEPLTDVMKRNSLFCDGEGMYHGKINRYRPITLDDRNAVYMEFKAQAEKMKQVGFVFHHADSHHHIHTAPFITPIVCAVMKEYGIKHLRLHRNIGDMPKVKVMLKEIYNARLKQKKYAYSDYFGAFSDLTFCSEIAKEEGVLEIMCHPDFDKEGKLIDRLGVSLDGIPFGIELSKQYVLLRGMIDNA